MSESRSPLRILLPALALVLLVGMSGGVGAQESAKLSYKKVQKWNFVTPTEKWNAVSGEIPIAHAGGSGFAAEIDGHALVVDTTGNGKPNCKVKGVSGDATLSAKDSEGRKFKYALRFKKEGAGWKYASAGVMQGKVLGVPIRILDLNHNGVWNEVGEDGMIVGKGSAASFLSKVVNLKGELYEFSLTADGRSMTIKPFQGETGVLNVRKGFKANGKLVSAVVMDDTGDYSFNLANAKNGMKVPAGEYSIAAGRLKRGGASVRMRAGRMAPLKVRANQPVTFTWGAPIRAEFSYNRSGTKITIEPSSLKFYDRSGVEYFGWMPVGQSPKFIVKDRKTGKEISSGRFCST